MDTQDVKPSDTASSGQASPLRYRRIVVKAGTGVLTGGTEHLDQPVMASLAAQIAHLHSQGAEIILVSSGAVAAGRQVLGSLRSHRDIPFRQVLAAVGQGQLMHIYEALFAPHNITVAQALLTHHDLEDRVGYLNVRNTLLALMDLGVVPIINENDVVASEEIGPVFGDNDRLSALVANLVDADLLAILTDTHGLYTADPDLDPNAQLIRRVERVDGAISALASKNHGPQSRGGMVTKLEAARLAAASGVAVVICHGREPNVIVRLARGEEVGTYFVPTASKMESRKRWMLSGLSTRGEIQVDKGAAEALCKSNRSLLPAGVRGVSGRFSRGEIIYIVDPQGQRIACGITNYSSDEVERIKGARSSQIQEVLGYHYGAEVVHRNNLVLL